MELGFKRIEDGKNLSKESPAKNYCNEFNLSNYKELFAFLHKVTLEANLERSNLIYRGVGDSIKHTLVPTALRKEGGESRLKDICLGVFRSEDFSSPKIYSFAEMIAFSLFYQQANAQGLPLPIVSTKAHSLLLKPPHEFVTSGIIGSLEDGGWPNSDILPILALAQHYGVPTRLLDWSTDPYVSLYFAAKDAINNRENSPNSFALWMLNRSVAEEIGNNRFSGAYSRPPKYHLEFVETPQFQNPNLAAQNGIFSVLKINPQWVNHKDRDEAEIECVDRSPLDEALLEISKCLNIQSPIAAKVENETVFVKIMLPNTEAANVLRVLRNMGYHGGTIFPGYDGCEKSIRELELIKRHS
ncbi:FRG domain-containing protein [Pseudophaeobacter sp.]|uniref:FRG domain-containing protein n=1 Tax=Pseudophaeobacter sp. TaxID=1971739 RepID=UPI0032968888